MPFWSKKYLGHIAMAANKQNNNDKQDYKGAVDILEYMTEGVSKTINHLTPPTLQVN